MPSSQPSTNARPSEEPSKEPSFSPTKCVDTPGWYDGGGEKFDCKWYAEKQERCFSHGFKFPGMFGKTANEACCSCGGSSATSVSPSISAPPTSSARPTAEHYMKCMDYPKVWFDSDGPLYNCKWYASEEDLCQNFGGINENFGLTANKVCCTCGGGIIPPSHSPSPSQSPNPSSAVSGQCYSSHHGWYDSDGPTYDCEWYSFGDRCDNLGHLFKNFGKTAKEACCECSGGRYGREWFPSSAPTTFPSFSLLPSISNAPTDIASQKPSSSPSVSSKPSNAPSSILTSSPTIDESTWGTKMINALDVSDEFVSNQKVCIVGSGYDVNHPDLPNNPRKITGWSPSIWVDKFPWYRDELGLGTHEAGIITAKRNGEGMHGVIRNGQVNLHIAKIYGGENLYNIARLCGAIHSCIDAGANIINMSLYINPDPCLTAALEKAVNENVLLIAAAGDWAPASYDEVMSVAAVDADKSQVSFVSQENNKVDIAAPGVDIESTCTSVDSFLCRGSEPYGRISGTAVPFVSGVAALIWSHCPSTCTAVDIRHILKESALNPSEEAADFDPHKYGSGIVNAKAAYEYARSNGYFGELPSRAPSSSYAPTTSNAPIDKASQKPSSFHSVSTSPSNVPSSLPSSPTIGVAFLIQQSLTNVIGPCAINRSCPSTAMNSASNWFIDPDNHPDDLSLDLQVWKVSSRTI